MSVHSEAYMEIEGLSSGNTSITIGSVEIATYSPVKIPGIERGTNLYFYAKNNGSQKVTLILKDFPEIEGVIFWAHFFAFFDTKEGVELDPGEEKTLEFFISADNEGQAVLPFEFKIEETSEEGTLNVDLTSSKSPEFHELSSTATVSGQITTGSGQPLEAEVRLYTYNACASLKTETDAQGNYSISCPAVEDIQEAFGSRSLPYSTLGYFLVVEKDGYSLGYKGDISPSNGETNTVNLKVDSVSLRSYLKIGELATEGVYGYWWLFPNTDFTKLAAVQARHPPQLDVLGHFLMTDLSGQELWRISTNNECWGFDYSVDGLIAAGCHDGTIHMANSSGNLLWTNDEANQSMNREVEFSPDGKYLFTGPCGVVDSGLLDTNTGEVIWTHSVGDYWLRNSRFSPDGKRIIAGYSGGRMDLLTDSGTRLWTNYIGEFPMVLEIDDEYNVYGAGKNRELFSYDSAGNLRWRERIPNHVVTAGSDNMCEDGSLIVMGTVGGLVIAIDKSGKVAWQRQLPGTLQGHNALDMTPDGNWIVVGAAGEEGVSGTVVLYDRNGADIWSHESADRRDTGERDFQYEYDHNQRGAITVAISDDAKYIAAGYGDSTIRIFKYFPAPSSLTAAAVSGTQIDLSWTDNSDDEKGFKIERKTGEGGMFSDIKTVEAGTTSYSDTGLSASTTYYYRVKAYNDGGNSANSNTASAATKAGQTGGDSSSSGDTGTGNSGGGGGCFIATACYGTSMAEEVRTLCAFRDKYLLTNPAGLALIKLYYRYSPVVADFIRDKEHLMAVVRECLRPFIWTLKKIK
ncbi:MAG: CFI-box-CTERM domain-containing protein [Candidatus Hydrothermarchaeaceae archaeon]